MVNLDFLNNNYEDTRTYQEKVCDSIILDIMNGNLRPGSRIIEQKICDKYHISRTPVREILNQLSSTGLIKLIPMRGAFVIGVTEQDIDDYYTMRYLLYPQAVKWAIERIDKETLDKLDEVFNFLEFYAATEDIDKVSRIQRGYNSLIYDATKNAELAKILQRGERLITYANQVRNFPTSFVRDIVEEYRSIHEAFMQRNAQAGEEAARVYVYKSILRRR